MGQSKSWDIFVYELQTQVQVEIYFLSKIQNYKFMKHEYSIECRMLNYKNNVMILYAVIDSVTQCRWQYNEKISRYKQELLKQAK